MKILNNIRIKNKIILIIVIIGTVSSLTGNLISYFYELKQSRERLISDTQMHARLISEYCCLPLEFNYPEEADKVLQKLSVMTSISDGILYTSNDSVFAEYHSDKDQKIKMPDKLNNSDYYLDNNYLHVKNPVYSKQGLVGYVYLCSEIDMQSIMLKQLSLSILLTLFMISIIWILAFYFQRSISEPLIRLTTQMQEIAYSNNYVEATSYNASDEIGELYKGFNFMIDRIKIREREKQEVLDELKLSEKQYQNLYENAPVMYISVDVTTAKIIMCNDTLCQTLGYTKDELIGKEVFEFYHPESRDKINMAFNRFKTSGSVVNQEFKVITKDGKILDISLDSTAARDEHENIIFSRSVWRDITLQKQAKEAEKAALEETRQLLEFANRSRLAMLSVVEDQKLAKEEIQKLNSTLEQRVSERTAQLEAVNKELEAFSYSVSHDLRAPLRHISGFSDLLSMEMKDQHSEKGLHYLNTIKSSAKQMGVLIDDLLSFSRAGRSEVNKTIFDMNKAVKEAITKQELAMSERKITWNLADLPEVFGDYNLLHLAWINLIDNAAKYSRRREEALISINYSELKNEYVFSISDNGVGFEMQYADKLFGVFQRLHPYSEFEGTGIGLANVRRIILKHGGRIWAEAKLNEGATFYFSIPKFQKT